MNKSKTLAATVPLRWVGPLAIEGSAEAGQHCDQDYQVKVPLATYETPLWPSVARCARLSSLVSKKTERGGIVIMRGQTLMTRSICLEADSVTVLAPVIKEITENFAVFNDLVAADSRFADLTSLHTEVVGRLLFLRVGIDPADAAGHNMVTKAAEKILNYLLNKFPACRYVSLSGNLCTDKKVSSINAINGRGRPRTAELVIPAALCESKLRASALRLHNLNTKKNYVGSIVAGSLHSANAHFANMLLAIYLATGQDAANIVEGSQGITYTDASEGELYFSVKLPSLIVGTVGNGKHLNFVSDNLAQMGCQAADYKQPGGSAERLADIIAATVLCGELSLLAALTNQGELVRSHVTLER